MDLAAVQNIFTTLPVDIVAAVLFATAITIDTLRAGASRAIALSLALVVSLVLFDALPATLFLGPALDGLSNPMAQSAIFIGLTLAFAFVIYKMSSTLSDDSARPVLAIATGAATTIVVLTVWQMSPELQSLWKFNPMIQSLFDETYRLYWLIFAFIAFAFVKS